MIALPFTPENIDKVLFEILNKIYREESKIKKQKEDFKIDISLATKVISSLESKGITYEVFSKLLETNKISTLFLILKEAAIILDKKYKDNHIKDCTKVWIIDFLTKKPVVYTNIKDLYKVFPLFRTEEDAYRARSLVKDLLDMI